MKNNNTASDPLDAVPATDSAPARPAIDFESLTLPQDFADQLHQRSDACRCASPQTDGSRASDVDANRRCSNSGRPQKTICACTINAPCRPAARHGRRH